LSAHFNFRLTDEARDFLLAQGTDYQYGARHLKRSIERFLVHPFANLLTTGQVRTGDLIVVDANAGRRDLAFFRDDALASIAQAMIERLHTTQSGSDRNRLVA
jgi:ATP-dependent Clp protease ATP-binding subunit ClpA